MDYSKFYLKNYIPEDEETDDRESIIFPRLENRSQPEIIYINPDGEVFDPKVAENFRENDLVESERNAPAIARSHGREKQSYANRFCQAVLICAIVIMSLVVSIDFLTDGKAIAALSKLSSSDKIVYYAVLTNPKQDVETSKADAYAIRLKGGAGFIVKNADLYYNVFAVYKDEDAANDVADEYGGNVLTLETDFYDDVDGELENYTDYPKKLCESLNSVSEELTQKKITSTQAIEKLNDVKEDFAVTYDNMNSVAAGDETSKSLTLLANASVAMSALESLCDLTVSRPNLVCDVRYTVCQVLFVYCYSK